MNTFQLPEAPPDQASVVKAWSQPVLLPTYEPLPPDKNPMFLENRVYQGSSGRIYPLPFTDRIATEPADRVWQAIHLENEFLRVLILPEIGGRIHIGLDKTNGYDFFYSQNVIKPALVGLAGPWISGGVEFNWPQHHRPATFLPVQTHIEEHENGSRTVWCSDHDPMNRMKGMHGVCLHPGRSYIELKVRLYNRTPFVQSFLWWANAAARAHEYYQSFFPPDVEYVADHAKRAVSRFPLCEGTYYGVDYGARARSGVPAEELPSHFVPPGFYPPNDLSWYANIPVPTSYMAVGSTEDFFGGYDHAKGAGFVHVANRHISPGKKQWTWGNHEFGYAWDRNLTDADGPYVELMAGVYTDNQPDFSFLAPGETKAFSQFWYPIQKIGPVQKANIDAALSLLAGEAGAHLGVCVTRTFPKARIVVKNAKGTVAEWTCDLTPGEPFVEEVSAADVTAVVVQSGGGRKLISYSPAARASKEQPPAQATEPPVPEETAGNDELYVTALHLEQYRHATRRPEAYWREALRRDPGDARCNNALGVWHLRRGEFTKAELHLRAAIARLTQRNPNAYDGEPYFYLGVTLRYLGCEEEAYAAFYKAAWNYEWRAPAYHALAELDIKRGDWESALAHLRTSLRTNADNNGARNLLMIALRQLGLHAEAGRVLQETLSLDQMDQWARWLANGTEPADNQMRLDLAFDYARAGLHRDAIEVLKAGDFAARDGSAPMLCYAVGHFYSLLLDRKEAAAWRAKAADAPPDYCFPSRLEEMAMLEAVLEQNPADARALYYLGNLLYDRRRHEEALSAWQRSAELDPSFPTVWRNLGIAYFNVSNDPEKAHFAFGQALAADPQDARIVYERDQLWKRTGKRPRERLRELERFGAVIPLRDDLSAEIATLYNDTGQPEQAIAVLASRKFQPWEGGEGIALGQYVRAHVMLGRRALANELETARQHFERALTSPENLGEAQHPLSNQSNVYYWLGAACESAGDEASARHWWQRAAAKRGDFQQMSVQTFSGMSYYGGKSLKRLGARDQAEQLFRDLLQYAQQLARRKATIDYFATSLPHLLLFNEDLDRATAVASKFLEAQARIGLGQSAGEQLIEEVLAMDPNHQMAIDFHDEIRCEQILQGAG